jgi:predicted lysophospholipase L1 biosynthesis ABC-type transport system permease subunit
MTLPGIVLRHQLFYARKILPVILLIGLILFVPVASWLLVRHITELADKPLASLDSELILQYDSGDKDAASVRTKGLVEPFNLHSFPKTSTQRSLRAMDDIKQTSSALLLWQFDPQNTLTVVGLDINDPLVGLRKTEELLMPNSQFFSSNQANEVILERHFARLFGHKRGSIFELADQQLTIVGMVDFTEQSNLSNAAVFLPYQTALKLSGQEDEIINQVFVSLTSATKMESASEDISAIFPDFSLINRNSLYNNLSAFNQLITRGGQFLIWLVTPLSLLLVAWVVKMHRLEFSRQTRALRTIGWSRQDLRFWFLLDTGYLIIGGLLVALMLSLLVQGLLLPWLQIAPVLDQSLKL